MANFLLEFPCDFTIKVMGKTSPEFNKIVLAIVRRHFPKFADDGLHKRFSRFTNYMSISVTVHAESKQQLDNLYRELTSSPEILIAL